MFLDFSSTSVLSSPMKEEVKQILTLPTKNELFTLLLVRDGHVSIHIERHPHKIIQSVDMIRRHRSFGFISLQFPFIGSVINKSAV
jgi:hypothetical protein